jgi:hypothetical protein
VVQWVNIKYNCKFFIAQAQAYLCKMPNSGTKSRPKSFLLAIHSHLYSFLWDFDFFKLTQPLTVSPAQLLYTVKEKGGKPDRKPYPLPYGLRNP